MEAQSFNEVLSQKIDNLCIEIRRVYHLDSTDALQKLQNTHFYKCLNRETSELWKQDANTLFFIYQDEVEYGKLFPFS